jgi:cellobiose transport system permease protein
MSIVAPRLTASPARRGRGGRRGPGGLAGLHKPSRLAYALLLALIAGSAFPVYWTFVAASGTNEVIASTPPALLLGGHLLDNISRVFTTTEFALALRNSVIVSGTVTISLLLFSTLAGFAFAKMRFRGRDAALLVVIGTMMVPTQLGIIPLYILMNTLGLAGKLPAVILPFMVTGFGVFFMRQFISEAVPDELLEAARVDGATTLGTFWHVVVPAVRPALAVLGLFTFMTNWNEFFWPLVVLNPDSPTVQVALSSLSSGYYTDYSLVLAGTALATLPMLVLLVLFGRQIIAGIMEGAVKG